MNSIKQKELLNKLSDKSSLRELQDYIKKVIKMRISTSNTIEQQVLFLMEETGELAKAIRKEKTNMHIDKQKLNNYDTVEHEIGDVFIVLAGLCNMLDIDMFEAIIGKEQINCDRNWEA